MLIALLGGVLALTRMASGASEIPLRSAELVAVQDPVLRPFGDAELSSAETSIGGTRTLMAYDAGEDLLHLVSGERFETDAETLVETRDGTTLELLGRNTFERPVLSIAAGDGYLFVVDVDFLTQFDSVGNVVRVVDFPTARTVPLLDRVPAVAQGRLWFGAPPALQSMDVETGAITNHELVEKIGVGLAIRPIPLSDGLVLLQQAGGRWVVDVSGPLPAVVADWGGTPGASHLTADGRLLVSHAQASLKQVPDNLKELSLVDGTVIEEVTIPDRH